MYRQSLSPLRSSIMGHRYVAGPLHKGFCDRFFFGAAIDDCSGCDDNNDCPYAGTYDKFDFLFHRFLIVPYANVLSSNESNVHHTIIKNNAPSKDTCLITYFQRSNSLADCTIADLFQS